MQSFPPLLILLGISFGISIVICDAVSPLDLHQVHFRNKVEDALHAVGTILNTTRHPVLLEDADQHTYNDKYAMVDTMTNTLAASAISVLKQIGLSHETLVQLVKAVQDDKKPVSLHFRMDQTCDFVQQTKRKVIRSEMDIENTLKSGSGLIGRLASSSKENIQVKATIQDYEWKLSTPYRVFLKIGDDEEIELQNRSDMETEIVLLGSLNKQPTDQRPPAPLSSQVHDLTVNMTWLFQQIMIGTNERLSSEFSVDRQSEACKTPRRNKEIEEAFVFRNKYEAWANEVSSIFQHLEMVAPAHDGNRRPTTPEELEALESMMFAPILPLFEGSAVLPTDDIDLFLSKHDDSMADFVHSVEGRYPEEGYMSQKDITLTSLLRHLGGLMESWADSVDYVEDLLQKQLVQAIGKELTPKDFDRFMSHYSKHLLTSEFAPKPFSYAIRRGGQFPDGTISIEGQAGEGLVETMVRQIPGGDSNPPIALVVDAATSINLQGDRYLHGWVQHRWGLDHGSWKRNLVARANQFSSFLVVLGVMSGPDTFVPKDAIIVQNKDEVLIPLLSNTLPSAKEFRDSISSLSPEQRAFAEAYRKMQLESSVFGVCIIQIKPQLEKLLNLPEGALTKEIQLTQDLMTLFADYQIPSDLLSFDQSSNGNEDEIEPSVKGKVETVRKYASAVLETLERAEDKELDDAKKRAKLQEAIDGRVEAYSNEQQSVGTHYSSRSQQRRIALEMASGPPPQQMAQPQMAFLSGKQVTSDSSTQLHKSRPPPTPLLPKIQDAPSSNDLTLIPSVLDSQFEKLDKDGALKSTIVQTSKDWERSRQKHLLMGWEQNQRMHLSEDELTMERNKAIDLLVAISRSGSLPIKCCELHILVAVSHCFEQQIMETIIQDNINPIEKVTKSMSMIASVIHNANASSIGGKKEENKSTIED
mmetsp:Transcript_16928/g.41233  ORF Transcript_16928/g.41233 Transcript_16928/m.41233 type:complete len:927 (+) Transcript_16928:107-2887(+)